MQERRGSEKDERPRVGRMGRRGEWIEERDR